VVRYAFPVRLFHSLLHAGLSRRYPDTSVCRLDNRVEALVRVCPQPAQDNAHDNRIRLFS